MIDLGPHAVFIIAAYVGVAAVTAVLIVLVALDGHAKRKRLQALEALRKPEEHA
jgi:heme exporter protein D